MSKSPGASPKEKSSLLLRKGSSTKIPLKEKIVQIYEAFFRGEDPSTGNPNFWDELFLLKVNGPFIEAEFEKLNGEQLVGLKDNMNLLFGRCVQTLNHEHNIRVVNALQTMTALVRGIFKKNLGDFGFDVINLLMGFDSAETQMQMLVESLNSVLNKDSPAGLKGLALQFFLVLVTATDNVSQNTLLEYVMINSIFESIIQLLSSPIARQSHGHDAVLMMTLLVQYRKYESANPYIVKLSILDDELALTGYAQVVSGTLTDFNREYQSQNCEPEGGFFTALSNLVGSMFVAEEKKIQAIKANDSMLLALYEAIHLNRNFITTLTHSHTPASPATPPSTPTDTSPPALDSPQSGEKPDLSALAEHANHPTNLLVTFLEYSSIVMQDIRDEARFNNAKLCLIILTCIVEDQYANSLMHDINMNFRVPLHRIQMRHRKLNTDKNPPFRPLAASVLELMVEFVMSHMMKNFPMELHMRCIGVIQRILCYQKKCRVRLQYAWKDLWTGLINLLKFLLSNENHLLKKHDIFLLASRVVNIFNLFVTYGDTFLPNPHSYDELYYEIIRMHQIFDNLFSMALRYTTTEGQWKESSVALTNHLVNIRAIINHFTPKVDSWAASNHLSSLTEDQVLEVVKNNYDSLTLKLLDSLDQYERYVEKPKESGFFTNLVRSIIGDERKLLINASATYYQNLVHEFSTGT